jgi:hypothetical protein
MSEPRSFQGAILDATMNAEFTRPNTPSKFRHAERRSLLNISATLCLTFQLQGHMLPPGKLRDYFI